MNATERTVFTQLEAGPATHREREHGGKGPIAFRRLLDATEFDAPLDFVDYTIIPPGSTIGRHRHVGNEELYLVVAGHPVINVNGYEQRAMPGTVSIVRSGEWHELRNDTTEDVSIFVFQVRILR